MKKIPWFELALILGIMVSHTYAALSPEKSLMNWFRVDDAFYYFKTATNITNGLGVTFDGVNLTNGFHPLWMLICIPIFYFSRFNLYLPFRILVILLGVLNTATAILLYRWISKQLNKTAGMLAAIIWAFTPLIHAETSLSGLETGLSILFLVFLVKLISESMSLTQKITTGRLILIGSVAALAFLSRLDNIFIIFMLGLWFIFGKSFIRSYLILDAVFIMLAAYASLLLRLGNFIDIYKFSSGLFVFIGAGLIIKIPMLYFASLYQPKNIPSFGKLLRNLSIALISGELLSSIIVFFLSSTNGIISFSKSLPVYDLVISFVLIGGTRILVYLIPSQTSDPSKSAILTLKENWKDWLKNFTYYFGILGIVMLGYMLINQWFFHTPLPVSSQVKQWWGTMYTVYGIPARSFFEAFGIVKSQWNLVSDIFTIPGKLIPGNFLLITNVVEFLIIVYLILKNHKIALQTSDRLLLLPILGGSFWQIWTYNIRSYVGLNDWYWGSQLLFTVLFLVLVYDLFQKSVQTIDKRKFISSSLLVLISILIFSSYIVSITKLIRYNHPEQGEGEYLFGVSFLEKNTEPGSIIGFTGGGTMAYFIQDRVIVNLDGLINSTAYFQSLKDYRASEFLDNMGMDYIFAKPFIIQESAPYKDEFPHRLELISYYQSYALYRFLPVP